MLLAAYMQSFHLFPILYFDEFLNKLLLHRHFFIFLPQFLRTDIMYITITTSELQQKMQPVFQQTAQAGALGLEPRTKVLETHKNTTY
jgi:hypothetical protein